MPVKNLNIEVNSKKELVVIKTTGGSDQIHAVQPYQCQPHETVLFIMVSKLYAYHQSVSSAKLSGVGYNVITMKII